jgi:hypothetical protein
VLASGSSASTVKPATSETLSPCRDGGRETSTGPILKSDLKDGEVYETRREAEQVEAVQPLDGAAQFELDSGSDAFLVGA